ncbi:MAG: A24 family peptidase [Nanoarchaeota archaeon]|jgi:Flp pilus assembly protein protease CpaA|nr:A24 family peptidase [Nanoarchaeota archaeon]
MFEVYVLWAMAIIWIVFATVEDIRTREIANWLNLSLAVFALGFRFFYSLFEMGDMSFFYQGAIGLGIFFALGNVFYYGKMFAGGDAKLMMSLGAILPIYGTFYANVKVFLLFLFLFLIVGALYGLIVSVTYGFINFSRLKKELKKQINKNRSFISKFIILAGVILISSFVIEEFFYFGIFVFVMPYFYLYIKSVDEACMIKNIKPSKLTVGDWLYEDVNVGRKLIRATWDGVSEEDIKLLQKKDKILVRYGIQFAPVFLISFLLMIATIVFGLYGF